MSAPQAKQNDAGARKLERLFTGLAVLLDQGSEPIAKLGAQALRRHAETAIVTGRCDLDLVAAFEPALRQAPEPADVVADYLYDLDWHHSGSRDGRIHQALNQQMLTVELLGDSGMMHEESCRVGLFAQNAGVDYPVRTHAAEEIFVIVAGTGLWRQGGEPERACAPGDRILHPSMQPHASRTLDEPQMAIWVWAGDLRFETYQLSG